MILPTLGLIVVIALLILVNALYVAGEFAAVSVRKVAWPRWPMMATGWPRSSSPLEDRQKLDNFIAACQVGITLSSIVLGIYGQQQIRTADRALDREVFIESYPGSQRRRRCRDSGDPGVDRPDHTPSHFGRAAAEDRRVALP